jgi:hypothetical protein
MSFSRNISERSPITLISLNSFTMYLPPSSPNFVSLYLPKLPSSHPLPSMAISATIPPSILSPHSDYSHSFQYFYPPFLQANPSSIGNFPNRARPTPRPPHCPRRLRRPLQILPPKTFLHRNLQNRLLLILSPRRIGNVHGGRLLRARSQAGEGYSYPPGRVFSNSGNIPISKRFLPCHWRLNSLWLVPDRGLCFLG